MIIIQRHAKAAERSSYMTERFFLRMNQTPVAASGLWSTPYELMMIAKEFNEAVNGRNSFLSRESAREMIKPTEDFSWVGLGLFLRGNDTMVSQGWGENGQSMLKMNFVTGEISVVMTNRNPEVDQSESGVEQLTAL